MEAATDAHLKLRRLGVKADQHVTDVSGDEAAFSSDEAASAAQARAHAHRIRINGLPILSMNFSDQSLNLNEVLLNGYEQYVKTPNGFIEPARGIEDYARAMRAKLETETSYLDWDAKMSPARVFKAERKEYRVKPGIQNVIGQILAQNGFAAPADPQARRLQHR
jgi:hypothetical protein